MSYWEEISTLITAVSLCAFDVMDTQWQIIPSVYFLRNDCWWMAANITVSLVYWYSLIAPRVGGFLGIARIAFSATNQHPIVIDVLHIETIDCIDSFEQFTGSASLNGRLFCCRCSCLFLFDWNIGDIESVSEKLSGWLWVDWCHKWKFVGGSEWIRHSGSLESVVLGISFFDVPCLQVVGLDVFVPDYVAFGNRFDIGRVGEVISVHWHWNLSLGLCPRDICLLEGWLSDVSMLM